MFVDLDGTWLCEARPRPIDEDREAVAAAQAAGLRVFVNTGRSVGGALAAHRALGTDPPLFCYNGSVVHDPDTGRPLVHHALALDVVDVVMARAAAEDLPVLVFHGDRILTHRHSAVPEGGFRRGSIEVLATRDELPREGVTKLWVIAPPEREQALHAATEGLRCRWIQPRFAPQVLGFPAGPVIVSATAAMTMKRAALEWVAEAEGIPLSAMVMVGDHDNDLEAIEAAGLGVAVAGATAAVLAAADRVIGTPETGAVAALLRELAAGAPASAGPPPGRPARAG